MQLLRRRLACGAALMAGLSLARGQPAKRATLPRVGVLWHAGSQQEEGKYFAAMVEGFRRAGYVELQSIELEHRYPNEQQHLFQLYANELVATVIPD